MRAIEATSAPSMVAGECARTITAARGVASTRNPRASLPAGIAVTGSPTVAAPPDDARPGGSAKSFLRVTPRLLGLPRGLVDRPLRQRDAVADVAKHHAHAGADADLPHQLGRCQLPVGRAQIADHAQRLV